MDSAGILWTLGGWNNSGGRLTYFNTAAPTQVGALLTEPWHSNNHFYGITVDSDDNLWIGTKDGGLDLLRPGSERFIHHRHDPAHRIHPRAAKGLIRVGQEAWIDRTERGKHICPEDRAGVISGV